MAVSSPVRRCQAGGRAGTAVALEGGGLPRGGLGGRLPRVDADHDYPELLARVERDAAQTLGQAVQHDAAELGALVVGEHEHDGGPAEVVAEPDRRAGLVPEPELERHPLVQALIEPDLLKEGGREMSPSRGRGKGAGEGQAGR